MEKEYKVTKVKAALRLYENKDQVMEMVREFEERAESLGHRSLVIDAAKFAENLGVNLHLKHPDPVCAVKSGEIIPSHRVKEVLKECVEEKLEREVRGLEWQGKLLIERKSDSQLCKNGCFSWLSKWKSWELKEKYKGYEVHQYNIIMDVLGGWSEETEISVQSLVGRKTTHVLERMQKPVLSVTLNIARTFKAVT